MVKEVYTALPSKDIEDSTAEAVAIAKEEEERKFCLCSLPVRVLALLGISLFVVSLRCATKNQENSEQLTVFSFLRSGDKGKKPCHHHGDHHRGEDWHRHHDGDWHHHGPPPPLPPYWGPDGDRDHHGPPPPPYWGPDGNRDFHGPPPPPYGGGQWRHHKGGKWSHSEDGRHPPPYPYPAMMGGPAPLNQFPDMNEPMDGDSEEPEEWVGEFWGSPEQSIDSEELMDGPAEEWVGTLDNDEPKEGFNLWKWFGFEDSDSSDSDSSDSDSSDSDSSDMLSGEGWETEEKPVSYKSLPVPKTTAEAYGIAETEPVEFLPEIIIDPIVLEEPENMEAPEDMDKDVEESASESAEMISVISDSGSADASSDSASSDSGSAASSSDSASSDSGSADDSSDSQETEEELVESLEEQGDLQEVERIEEP